MRILVSDYSGHPFQVQLSRALAARGHEVTHVYSASFQTPKGRLAKGADDPENFSIEPVVLAEKFEKGTFIKRRGQEIAIGRKIGELIRAKRPDIVISSNAPLDTQKVIQQASEGVGAKFVFWVQDIYSRAITEILARKLPVIGRAIGGHYRRLEAAMLRKSDHIVLISRDFEQPVGDLAGTSVPTSVVENWAPLDELPPGTRDNDWAQRNMEPTGFRAVYSGTLGFKHNPDLILDLAETIRGDVLVFSEGDGADYLKAEAARRGLANLQVSQWLPFDELPSALAAADVLLVVLEADAGRFSVPSKTLTYMCAGRPILAAMPKENLAARLIERNDAGLVAATNDRDGFLNHARALEADKEARERMGRSARAYAERTFDIDHICDRFEAIIDTLSGPRPAQTMRMN